MMGMLITQKRGEKIIREVMEPAKEYYTNRISKIKNSFYMEFFEHAADTILADAYEYFVEVKCGANIFRECIGYMTEEKAMRFFKIMVMFYTINFIDKKADKVDAWALEEELYYAFDFNEKEEVIYGLLKYCSENYRNEFMGLFSLTVAKYLFPFRTCGHFSLAFIENFCYNSYKQFLVAFTKYMTISRRLEKMTG